MKRHSILLLLPWLNQKRVQLVVCVPFTHNLCFPYTSHKRHIAHLEFGANLGACLGAALLTQVLAAARASETSSNAALARATLETVLTAFLCNRSVLCEDVIRVFTYFFHF